MKHDFLDKYSGLESPLHSFHPQLKVLLALAIIISISLTPLENYFFYLSLFFLFLLSLILSRVPPVFIFKRSLVVLPFLAVLSLSIFLGQGRGSLNLSSPANNFSLFLVLSLFLKAWLSMLFLSLLASTTPFSRLLKSLEKMGFPPTVLNILSFLYRYLFLFIDQGERMARAFYSRGKASKLSLNLKTFGGLIGVLFLRSYERSERVYQAMLARGYQGESLPSYPLAPIEPREAALFIFFLGFILIFSGR